MLIIGIKCDHCGKIGATIGGVAWVLHTDNLSSKIVSLVQQLRKNNWEQTTTGKELCPTCVKMQPQGRTVTNITEKIEWVKLVSCIVGNKYGHLPGHTYHDVEVKIKQLGEKSQVKMKYVWGSAQGCDEEHGRHEIVALGDSLDAVIASAEIKGQALDMPEEYMLPALTKAHSDAYDTLMGVEQS